MFPLLEATSLLIQGPPNLALHDTLSHPTHRGILSRGGGSSLSLPSLKALEVKGPIVGLPPDIPGGGHLPSQAIQYMEAYIANPSSWAQPTLSSR